MFDIFSSSHGVYIWSVYGLGILLLFTSYLLLFKKVKDKKRQIKCLNTERTD